MTVMNVKWCFKASQIYRSIKGELDIIFCNLFVVVELEWPKLGGNFNKCYFYDICFLDELDTSDPFLEKVIFFIYFFFMENVWKIP